MPQRTTKTTTTNPPQDQERKQPQKRNDVPSSGKVSLDDIRKLAQEADMWAKEEQAEGDNGKPKRSRKTTGPRPAPDPRPVLPAEPVLIVTDPEFEAMLQWGIGAGVDWTKVNLDWSEPGLHWRNKCAVLVGRLWQRLQPMSESWVTDVITLGGYAALWALPNVSTRRKPKSPAPDRNNGERQNAQDEGIVRKGA